jgi:alkanesulfonate monooxygenase SsuD/methylene tetrahydromethanopterin reductase-like flavin-dependent oxidoreductase (luciferase family)
VIAPTIGLGVSTSAAAGDDPIADAQRAERLGFDFVSASDHPCGTNPTFETWTMLTWIAAATTRISVMTRVLGVPYRPPAIVAKMAESLDRLSNGRLILGLGGGYSNDEFRAFGLRVPTPREKVDGLEEAVIVMRGLWSQRSFTFPGRHHHTVAADLEPKPRRDIPIWLGTFGPRALEVTGRVADGWIPSHGYVPSAELGGMRTRVLRAVASAGGDPESFTCAYNVPVYVGDHADPNVVSGSVAVVTDQLLSFVRLGFRTVNLQPQGPDVASQVECLAADVLPALRSA